MEGVVFMGISCAKGVLIPFGSLRKHQPVLSAEDGQVKALYVVHACRKKGDFSKDTMVFILRPSSAMPCMLLNSTGERMWGDPCLIGERNDTVFCRRV